MAIATDGWERLEGLSDGTIALRRWRAEDVPVVFEACQDHDVRHWNEPIPSPYREEHARELVELSARTLAERSGAHLAVTDASTGEVLGAIGLTVGGEGSGDLGWWVRAERRGRGTMPRAIALLAGWARAAGFRLLVARVAEANAPSRRAAEKAGFRLDALVPAVRWGTDTTDARYVCDLGGE